MNNVITQRYDAALSLSKKNSETVMLTIEVLVGNGAAKHHYENGMYLFSMLGRKSSSTMNPYQAVKNWIKTTLKNDAPAEVAA